MVGELLKRVEANDAGAIYALGNSYHHRLNGFQQDHVKAIELYTRAAELGSRMAHSQLADIYRDGGDMKKAKFHVEAAAMAGNEVARFNSGVMEAIFGNVERSVKHWTIAASAGDYKAMHHLRILFEKGAVSRESIDSTLVAYNDSCAEVRSEARDAYMRRFIDCLSER
jgi:TPR repeat protein